MTADNTKEDEFYGIKWLTENTATRKTREVEITAFIFDNGKQLLLNGSGDLEHHLIEDAAILLRKMAEVKYGHGV